MCADNSFREGLKRKGVVLWGESVCRYGDWIDKADIVFNRDNRCSRGG